MSTRDWLPHKETEIRNWSWSSFWRGTILLHQVRTIAYRQTILLHQVWTIAYGQTILLHQVRTIAIPDSESSAPLGGILFHKVHMLGASFSLRGRLSNDVRCVKKILFSWRTIGISNHFGSLYLFFIVAQLRSSFVASERQVSIMYHINNVSFSVSFKEILNDNNIKQQNANNLQDRVIAILKES